MSRDKEKNANTDVTINANTNISTKNYPTDSADLQQGLPETSAVRKIPPGEPVVRKKPQDLAAVWKRPPDTREEMLEKVEDSPELRNPYRCLPAPLRERFLDFLRGARTLPLTYDPFFKAIFDPRLHPERLSGLISSLLGIPVKVKEILPTEDRMLDGESLLIMDVLVELEDGSLTNVEIQKVPYAFPAERMTCYSSDLVMRQYARTKSLKGDKFSYKDMRKVYTIVIFENSAGNFHRMSETYIHRGRIAFDTGLEMDFLQEYCLVALDVFRQIPYAVNRNEQTAWLSLLVTETVEEAEKLMTEYPWLEEIYKEIVMLRQKPEEVLHMFSEALRIMDRNTVKYMVEEQQKELEEQKKELARKQRQINDQQEQLGEKQRQIDDQQEQLTDQQRQLHEKDQEIRRLREQLAKVNQKE